MKYIFSKLFISFLSLIIVFAFLLIYFFIDTTKTHYLDNFQRDLTNLNISISNNIGLNLYNKDTTSLRKYVNEIGKTLITRITIIGIDGKVLADTKANADTMDNHLHRLEIEEASKLNVGQSSRLSHTIHSKMLYVASKIYYNNTFVGYVRTSYYLNYLNVLINNVSNEIIKLIIILVLISIIPIYYISNSISKPLKELTTATKKIATGNFEKRVSIKGKNEISVLSENFNFMADELSNLFQKVNQQKDDFINLIKTIPDGICVLTSDLTITFYNDAFNSIFSKQELIGKNFDYFQISNYLSVQNSLLEKSNEPIMLDFDYDENSYKVSISYMNSRDEYLLVFHNITETKRLEKVKREFVANVSHELKTPLTAIKGFIETLEEDLEDSPYFKFIQIIRRNTDRLINIVQDLLLLSELENETMTNKLMTTSIDLNMLLDNLKPLFEQKLAEKNLTFDITIEKDFPLIQLDSYRIEQVFVNLINNSIKFTEKGGITIYAKKLNANKVQIEFYDTGAGIPAEDQERIFERFYISEKSRSKKFSGTGIGLSIVKHIILLHNGSINVDKSYVNGTKFIIILPRLQYKI